MPAIYENTRFENRLAKLTIESMFNMLILFWKIIIPAIIKPVVRTNLVMMFEMIFALDFEIISKYTKYAT